MDQISERLIKEIGIVIKDKGCNIDQVSYVKAGKTNQRSKLLLTISKLDNTPVSVEDCSMVSRIASMIIDVQDLIPEAYTLEVGSKTNNDYLVFFNDFAHNIGKLVKVNLNTKDMIGDFTGTITKVVGDKVSFKFCLAEECYDKTIPFKYINHAVLLKNEVKGEFNERTPRIG